ncbi:pentapeptide repeat-containing protein [Aureivirga sp. CE67]|uniref:pentapeptide repeat-containing protein n=1 Tax=Aureivirga sp. CE67 TaxID=1788983 RepID=UPI0018CB0BC5|nr:pentapeptide repeat-containing protein [Aureivirga sp. CE67]
MKKKKIIKDLKSLEKNIEFKIVNKKKSEISISNLDIQFKIEFPLKIFSYFKNKEIKVEVVNCNFKEAIFKDCEFNYKFKNSDFNDVSFENVTFEGKMRFHECNFQEETKFNNIVFKDLVDFWNSTFNKKVIFYKVDFEKTSVFSIVTFRENVLFTYSRFVGQGIFRRTTIKKGIDFSLAIIEKDLLIYDFELSDFDTEDQNLKKEEYESLITHEGVIPQKNKRETFRLIKKYLKNQEDFVEANKAFYLELNTYKSELKKIY